MKKRIGIDIDGVLYDFVGTFRDYVALIEHVDPDTLPDLQEWASWTQWGLTKARCSELFDGYIHAGGFLRGALGEGWKEALHKLAEKHHVILVTARGMAAGTVSPHARAAKIDTLKWLDIEGLSHIPIAFSLRKDVLGLDAHIDDARHHLEECDAAGILPICYDASHNQGWLGHRIYKAEEFPVLLEAVL